MKNEEYNRDKRRLAPITNSYKDRWENLYRNDIEKIFLAKSNEKNLQIMWNAADRKKKCTAGILNSHMSIIKRIVKIFNF